jgi:hypothetical protein
MERPLAVFVVCLPMLICADDVWWEGRKAKEMDVDATGKVKAGDNVIAVRVWNNAEVGGLLRRGFLWAPKQ